MRGLWGAIAFLSAVPVPSRLLGSVQVPPSQMLWWWVVVGGLMGGVAGVAVWLVDWRLPWVPCAALGVTLLVGLSGGLHLDGFADTCDGLGSRAPRERALEIMKDSRVGAFGAIGVVMLLLTKFSLLVGLGASWGVPAIAVAPVAGRLAQVWVMRTFGYARLDGGMGRAFFEATTGRHLVGGGVFASVLAWAWLKYAGLLGLAVSVMIAGLCATVISRRLGGHTGDTVGATSEAAEVAFLLALALMVGG